MEVFDINHNTVTQIEDIISVLAEGPRAEDSGENDPRRHTLANDISNTIFHFAGDIVVIRMTRNHIEYPYAVLIGEKLVKCERNNSPIETDYNSNGSIGQSREMFELDKPLSDQIATVFSVGDRLFAPVKKHVTPMNYFEDRLDGFPLMNVRLKTEKKFMERLIGHKMIFYKFGRDYVMKADFVFWRPNSPKVFLRFKGWTYSLGALSLWVDLDDPNILVSVRDFGNPPAGEKWREYLLKKDFQDQFGDWPEPYREVGVFDMDLRRGPKTRRFKSVRDENGENVGDWFEGFASRERNCCVWRDDLMFIDDINGEKRLVSIHVLDRLEYVVVGRREDIGLVECDASHGEACRVMVA